MASMCNVNAILRSHLDYYCLVCEDLFKNIEDVEQHVETSHHQNMLQKTAYAVDYEEHRIRKLKKGYFCEYCSDAFTTSAKMRFHIVKNEMHIYRKTNKVFNPLRSVLNVKRVGNRVLVSDLLIDEKPWYGILEDNTCLVCDEEIESLEDHKKLWSHALKISHTIFTIGKCELTRQIDDSLCQCLVCNEVIPRDKCDIHANTESHVANYYDALCCVEEPRTPAFSKVINKAITDNNGQASPKEIIANTVNNVKASPKEIIANTVNNVKLEPAFSKNNVEEAANTASKTEAKKNVNASVKQESQSTSDGETLSFVKGNNMIIKDDKTVLCNVCNVKVPFCLRNMREHVNGYTHRLKETMNLSNGSSAQEGKPKVQKTSCSSAKNGKKNEETVKPYKTQPFRTFLQSALHFDSKDTEELLLVFNDEILVEFAAFFMIERVENTKLNCQICEKSFHYTKRHLDKHFLTNVAIDGVSLNHLDFIEKMHVVTNFEKEFIREIRPGKFHCGYCNDTFPGWQDINYHVNSIEHIAVKIEAGRRAERINQQFENIERRQKFEVLRFLHMLRLFQIRMF